MSSAKKPSLNKEAVADISTPLEGLVGYQLRRASTAMRTNLTDRYEKIGLRLVEATVLIMIDENPGIKQSQIGNSLQIKSANMTPMVAFLEQNNHITRKRLDGRSQGLFLTPHGEKTIKEIWRCVDENENWIASCLTDIDKEAMIKSLKKIWQ